MKTHPSQSTARQRFIGISGFAVMTTVVAIAAIVLLGLGALVVDFSAVGSSNPPSAEKSPHLVVETRTVRMESGFTMRKRFVGTVEPARTSELSFELDGKLTALVVEEGDRVEKGRIIARLDTQRLRARREELKAQLAAERALLDELDAGPRAEVIEAAEADVTRSKALDRLAKLNLKRQEELLRDKVISLQQWDEVQSSADATAAELEAARARLRELRTGTRKEQIAAQRAKVALKQAEIESVNVDLGKSELRAPFAGTIGARHVDEGEVVATGAPVVDLLEMHKPEVRIGIAEMSVDALKMSNTYSIDVHGRRYDARLIAIRPDRKQTTRTVTALFRVVDPSERLRSGDLATLILEQQVPEPGFWLPIAALGESSRGLWSCFTAERIADKPGDPTEGFRLARRELEILATETDRAFVRGTIGNGDRVVVGGKHRLVPGQIVTVVSPEPDSDTSTLGRFENGEQRRRTREAMSRSAH